MVSCAELVAHYKKSGAFDEERAKVFTELADSEYIAALKERILEFAAQEVTRQPSLLDGDHTKAAALLEGAVARAVVQSDDNAKQQKDAIDKVLASAQQQVAQKLRSMQ